MRNRILDVLRFGTPMANIDGSTFEEENNVEALERDPAFRHPERSREIPLR